MKQNRLLIIIFVGAMLASGCAENSQTYGNALNSVPNKANAANQAVIINANSNSANANISPANAGTPTTPNIPANAAVNNVMPANVKVQPLTQSAPDDSEIETALGENLVKTRAFKNNSRLLKVEETTVITENNRKIIKVYLKNGQVKEISDGKIKDAMTETAANILKAVN